MVASETFVAAREVFVAPGALSAVTGDARDAVELGEPSVATGATSGAAGEVDAQSSNSLHLAHAAAACADLLASSASSRALASKSCCLSFTPTSKYLILADACLASV